MRPSIRSRVVASATAFVLGFGVANYGILRVPGAIAGSGSRSPSC